MLQGAKMSSLKDKLYGTPAEVPVEVKVPPPNKVKKSKKKEKE